MLFIPLILIVCAIIIGWFFVSKIFKKYNQYIDKMKSNGTFKKWEKENKLLILFEKFFDYASIFCFIGFVFLSMTHVPFETRIFIELLIPLKLISIALYLILYLKIDKSNGELLTH